MKKVLFLLGAVAMVSLVACNSKKDCKCDIVDAAGTVILSNAEHNQQVR